MKLKGLFDNDDARSFIDFFMADPCYGLVSILIEPNPADRDQRIITLEADSKVSESDAILEEFLDGRAYAHQAAKFKRVD